MTAAEPPSPHDVVGRAALVVGAIGALAAALLTLAQPFAIRSGGVLVLQALAAGRLLLIAVLGLAALALGVFALVRRRPRSPSGAGGAALGAVLLLDVLVGALTPLLF